MLMFDADIRDQAYQFFIQEAVEFLQILETGLMNLSQDCSTQKVHELMRAAHSIKGGAASVGLDGIQQLAYQLEDCLRALYQDSVVIDRGLEDLLLQAFDSLQKPLLQQIELGQYDEAAALAEAEPIYVKLVERLGDAIQAETAMPSAAELGIDIVEAIFAGDVSDGLKRLEQILANPNTTELVGEIRAQAEVFIGMGELVNLPGWVSIAKAVLAALQAAPALAREIATQALIDLQIAQQLVLNGDRTQGGSPSDALLAFATTTAKLSINDLPPPPARNEWETNEWETAALPISNSGLDEALWDDLPWENLPSEQLDELFGLAIDELPTIDLAESDPVPEVNHSDDIARPFDQTIEQNIDQTIEQNIDQTIQRLAKLLGEPIAPSQPETTPSSNFIGDRADAAHGSPANGQNVVRVEVSRLERMNNLVGEMVTQDNRLTLQNQQIQTILQATQDRFADFETLAKKISQWSDQTQKEKAKLSRQDNIRITDQTAFADWQTVSQILNQRDTIASFDPLQMDQYSGLYQLAQELLELIAQMGESIVDLNLLNQQNLQSQKQQQQILKQMRDNLLWARMLPLNDLFQRFPRMLRDLSSRYGKPVNLQLTGTHTLVDKSILQSLYDPLVHLLRNAFDHGIESPDERLAAGKPAEGTIVIRAYQQGNQTYIEIQDDGRGIDPDRIRAKAIEQGLLTAETAAYVSHEQLYNYLFDAGFSTADKVSQLSGRGVGLDAVMLQMRQLKGYVSIDSQLGQGTTFTLRFPLNVNITKLLVFNLQSCTMALSINAINAIATVSRDQIQLHQGRKCVLWQQQRIPLIPRTSFLQHYPLPRSPLTEQFKSTAILPRDQAQLLIVDVEGQVMALEVEQILQEQELVIKPFGAMLPTPACFQGCTILGNGLLVPVIDPEGMLQPSQINTPNQGEATLDIRTTATVMQPPKSPLILVIDDSLTTRQTLALTLQKAGYRVIQAKDGSDGLMQLQRESGICAVFSDVEMPVMNGFEFLTQCRKQYTKAQLPVIMLTSRGGDKHRQIAKYIGANDYLTKPYLEQAILQTLTQVLATAAAE